jgi:hypothetical protein
MNSLKDFYETAQFVRSTLAHEWGQDRDLIPSVRALHTKYRKKGSCQDILKDIYDGMSEERKNYVDGSILLTKLGHDGYSKSATHEILQMFYSGATPQEITAKRTKLHPVFAKVRCVALIHNAMKKRGDTNATREDAVKHLDALMNHVQTEEHQCDSDCSHNDENASDEDTDKDDWYTTLHKIHRNRLALQEQIIIDEAEEHALKLKKKRENRSKKRRRSREKKRNQSKKQRK